MPLLALPEPYDFELSTERFRAFGPDLANLWHEGGLHRVVDGREVRIEPAPGGLLVDGEVGPEVRASARAALRSGRVRGLRRRRRSLAPVVSRLRGFRPPLTPDPFEALVTSITAQQVSLFSAFAIRNRLIARFGVRAERAYAFPTAERLAAAEEHQLLELGFSRRKAEYVLGLARSEPDWAVLAGLPDEQVKARIVAVRGLGEWSADWFLARHLARPRAWPAGTSPCARPWPRSTAMSTPVPSGSASSRFRTSRRTTCC